MLKTKLLISVAVSGIVLMTGCNKQPYIAPKPQVQPKKVEVKKKIEAVSITGSATALKRLTVGGGDEKASSLSNSGKWLLSEVTSFDKSSNKNVKVLAKIDVLNPNIKMILTPSNSASINPVWMPDEKSFIYTTDRMGNNSIVQSVGTSGGSAVRFLTKNSLGNSRYPDVSSDGKKIVFNVNDNLALIDTDGNNMIMYGQGYRPKFSNDNQSIVYFQSVGKYHHIYTMTLDGSNMLQLTSEYCNDYAPVWSPNGKYIAFISDRVGKRTHLYVMDKNGGNILQLTDGDFDITSLTWGVDGNIYFSAKLDDGEDIWRLKPILN